MPKDQKAAELAKQEKLQKDVDKLKKSVEEGKEQLQEEANKGVAKAAAIKDLEKDIKE